jgi:hypothetical protein
MILDKTTVPPALQESGTEEPDEDEHTETETRNSGKRKRTQSD